MYNTRILHLAKDEKFIDRALLMFDAAFPNKNDLVVFSHSKNLIHVNYSPVRVLPLRNKKRRFQRRSARISRETYAEYDLVVFHSFGKAMYPEVFSIPDNVRTIWIGWGYDYYDLISASSALLLPHTRRLARETRPQTLRSSVLKKSKFCINILLPAKSRKRAIEKLTFFSPVLPAEYQLLRKARRWRKFPEIAYWNYGTIEEDLLGGFEGKSLDGNDILVGNSATASCNHIEAFDLIKRVVLSERNVVVPLSYGDDAYASQIKIVGTSRFGNKFCPLNNFLSQKDYITIIRRCGYLVMNHRRQQAVGNIVIGLYLGARVFLREENPTYLFLKEMGIFLSSVQELENDVSLLSQPLEPEQRSANRQLVGEYWSKSSSFERTKALVRKTSRL